MRTTKRAGVFLILALLLAAYLPAPVRAEGSGPSSLTLRASACRAINWLDSAQKADGGFGAYQSASASSPAATADAIYALALLGQDVTGPKWTTPGGKNPLTALVALGIPGWAQADPGQAGKVARAVALAGANPRSFGGLDLVATIKGFYSADTGLYHPAFLFRHTLAVEGLLRSGEAVPQAAYDALLANQLPDGGWFWSTSGEVSDVDATGRILQTLGRFGQVQAAGAYGKAADYLAGQQLAGGGWNTGAAAPANPVNANSTALAVGGLLAIGVDVQGARFRKGDAGALDTLLSFQEPSGALVYIREPKKEESRTMATIEALTVLAPLLEGQPPCQRTYLPLILARSGSN